jgi:hypothetical protein
MHPAQGRHVFTGILLRKRSVWPGACKFWRLNPWPALKCLYTEGGGRVVAQTIKTRPGASLGAANRRASWHGSCMAFFRCAGVVAHFMQMRAACHCRAAPLRGRNGRGPPPAGKAPCRYASVTGWRLDPGGRAGGRLGRAGGVVRAAPGRP